MRILLALRQALGLAAVLLALGGGLATVAPADAQDRARGTEVVVGLGAEPRTMLAVTIADLGFPGL